MTTATPLSRVAEGVSFIDRLDFQMNASEWAHIMRTGDLSSPNNEIPALVDLVMLPSGVTELTFQCPPLLDVSRITQALDALRVGSAYNYVELAASFGDSARFVLHAGQHDPLQDDYHFADNADTILSPPKQGTPQLSWCVGMTPSGRLLYDRWDTAEPNLLIAGVGVPESPTSSIRCCAN